MQDDRLEVTIAGCSRDGTCYVLAHTVIHGPTTGESVSIDLDDHLKQRWHHPLGGMIGVDAAAIDAGSGGHFDRVMKFCAARASRRVFAIKGASGFARPAFKASTSLKNRGHERRYIVGVDS